MENKRSRFNKIVLISLTVLFVGTIAAFTMTEWTASAGQTKWWMLLVNILIMAIPFGLLYGSLYLLIVGWREHTQGQINPRLAKILHLAPRIAAILIIFFISLFSLDVFGMEGTFLEKLGGFLVHNIPSIVLLIVLLFAWKQPVVGFAAFLIGAIAFAFYFARPFFSQNLLIFVLPILLIAMLFFADWRWNRLPTSQLNEENDAIS
jgi:heme/copper-type cytochrome/quinol oxidase subunit 2